MPLRIEKDFCIPHIHARHVLIILHREIEVILLGLQHFEPAVIRFEKGQRLLGIGHAACGPGLQGVVRVAQFGEGSVGLGGAWVDDG
jgi:hypothetical protein